MQFEFFRGNMPQRPTEPKGAGDREPGPGPSSRPKATSPGQSAKLRELREAWARLHEAVAPSVQAVLQIQQLAPDAHVVPEHLSQQLRPYLDDCKRCCEEAGLAKEDAVDIQFALVALTDELALQHPRLKQYWLGNLMQRLYFDTNRAGEEFFDRLDRLRKDPERREALSFYYLCLLLGFYGKYRVVGAELELANLVEEVGSMLGVGSSVSATPLSPFGKRPEEPEVDSQRHTFIIWLSALLVIGAVVTHVLLRLDVDGSANELVDELRQRVTRATDVAH